MAAIQGRGGGGDGGGRGVSRLTLAFRHLNAVCANLFFYTFYTLGGLLAAIQARGGD